MSQTTKFIARPNSLVSLSRALWPLGLAAAAVVPACIFFASLADAPLILCVIPGVGAAVAWFRLRRRFLFGAPPSGGAAALVGVVEPVLVGASGRREAWLSPDMLRRHLAVVGARESRRDLLLAVAGQWVAGGGGVAFCTPDQEAIVSLRRLATAVGRGPDLLVFNCSDGVDASFNPLGYLDFDAVSRLFASAFPRFDDSGADASTRLAAALLRAVTACLVELRDEGAVDLRAGGLVDHFDFRMVVDLSDEKQYPFLNSAVRHGVKLYLASLPAFQADKGYKQTPATIAAHQEAALCLGHAMWPLLSRHSSPVGGLGAVSPTDLVQGRRILLVRIPSGSSDGETAVRRYVGGTVAEAARVAAAAGNASAFMAVFDGPDGTAEVDPNSYDGVPCVVGSDGVAGGESAETVVRLSESSDSVTVAGRSHRFTPVRFRPPSGAAVGASLRLFLARPSVESLKAVIALPAILELMVDPDFAGENVEKARLDALASGDADLLAVARQYRAAMTAHSTDVDSGKVSGCAAVAGFAKKAGGAKQREEVAKFATLDAEGLFATPFDDKRPQPPRPVEPVGQPSAANVEWKTAPAGLVVIPASYSVTRSPDGRDDFAARRHSQLQPYRKLAGRMVPFSRVGDVAGVCAALADEFPHLAGLAERIVREVASKPHVSFRPILLHGSPGSGKTRFARRLCTALATDSVVYPCGGADDSSIGGTSCQWSSGRTSVPLQTVVRSGLANPCIILDEVEKVGTSRHNGNLSDVILGLTETESSGAYFDPFLEVEVDLSGVLWIATANAIGEVASPLLDRFRSLEVPLPDVEHAPSLVRSMALDIARSQGLAPQWAYRFSDGEVDAIAEAWGGGSLRRLRSLMEKVVAALDSNTSILH